MSRHRSSAFDLAKRMAHATARALSEEAAQVLLASGVSEIRVVPFDSTVSGPESVHSLQQELESLVRSAAIDELRETDVVVRLSSRERIGRCVAGGTVTSRRFGMADVRVKARVRTRWVHLFAESEATRAPPPLGSGSSRQASAGLSPSRALTPLAGAAAGLDCDAPPAAGDRAPVAPLPSRRDGALRLTLERVQA